MTAQPKRPNVKVVSKKEFERILEKNLCKDRKLLELLAKIYELGAVFFRKAVRRRDNQGAGTIWMSRKKVR